MPVNVTDDLAHVRVVLVHQIGLFLVLDLDDTASGVMPDRLAIVVFLPAAFTAFIPI